MARRIQRPEQAIQRVVFQHLATRRTPGTFAWHTPNGGQRRPTEAAIFRGLGVVPGIPDVLCVRLGRLYCLELKAAGGSPSPAQLEVMHQLERAGATVALAVGLDAAIARLEDWGLLLGRAT